MSGEYRSLADATPSSSNTNRFNASRTIFTSSCDIARAVSSSDSKRGAVTAPLELSRSGLLRRRRDLGGEAGLGLFGREDEGIPGAGDVVLDRPGLAAGAADLLRARGGA